MKNVLKLSTILLLYFYSVQTKAQFNYGEALQKSLFFYEAQQSGKLPAWNRVTWRDDSALDDGSGVGQDLSGGWYDAGDHVKFGFPMAFSVTALAWGGIEYEEAYKRSGQWDILVRNLRYVTDYFIKCHTAPNEFYGQLGNGGLDHAFWGAPEVMVMDRPAYKIDEANPGTELAAETAAALAAVSILMKSEDPAYSATLLQHAEELYNFADKFRGTYSESISDAAGFYRSFNGFQDELVWGAAWLYRATNEASYLTKAELEYDGLGTEGQSTDKAYKFAMSWDDKGYGSYVLLAQLTGKDRYKADAEKHLDFWTSGVNGEKVTYSPGGQAHLIQWGSLRYAANTSFLALVYSDKVATSAANKAKYHDFAIGQANYALGDNPINRSFMVGFGNNPANNPHHRSAHGPWANSIQGRPDAASHTLYGALVGGPSSPDDQFVDDRSDFIANEVACDYNACFTGVLVRAYDEFGGTPLANFPVAETPNRAEVRSMSKFNSDNAFGSTVRILIQNRTAWPARVTDKLSYRYFFDISEGVAQGFTIADYDVQLNSVQGNSTMSIKAWDAASNIYYAEISLVGEEISPIGDPQFRRETQLNFRVANGVPYSTANDWSAQGLSGSADVESVNIPVYDNGVLVFGKEPGGGSTPTTDGGIIAGGPFTFTVGDGIADNVSGVTLTGNTGANSQWVITDDNNKILGLPGTPEAVDFDGAGEGVCLIWHLSYADGLQGLAKDNNVSDFVGDYDLSNSITVTRVADNGGSTVDGGILRGGPFTFTVGDGIRDNALGVRVRNNVGPNSKWVVTDEQNTILLLPPLPRSVNFDKAGVGTCYIWHLSYDDGLQGLKRGNKVSDLMGTYDFSDSVVVNRVSAPSNPIDGGILRGGPFTFTVGDGIRDNAIGVRVRNNVGPNSRWLVTDEMDNILALPPRPRTVNFDGAGVGKCFIWHISFADGLKGLKKGGNVADLVGAFDLSNSITVNRVAAGTTVDGGVIAGGPFTFTVGDGIPDNVSGVTLTGNTGANSQWVITDDKNKILGLPGSPEAVDFDGAGEGVCLIWHLSYADGLQGLAKDNNVSDFVGDYDLSNSIRVVRKKDDKNGGGGGSADNEYIERFVEMRNEFYDPANGYFSADGSPHHSIETLIVEAPDHGHESTSELYSYWLWLEVMNGRITKDWKPLNNVWEKIEEFIIPTQADQPSNAAYNASAPAAYASEFPLPSNYPAPLNFGAPVGIDPVSPDLSATYGDDIYQMHWLLDNDNFYGYGNRGDGTSTPSYINTFQRGEQESVYETVPHPSWESFDWGGSDGFLPLFTEDANYSKQWRYTSAPDADARAVQVMYWAQVYAKEQGASTAQLDLDKATKMGDYLRLAMFDKYFKPLGVQSATSGAGTGYDAAHYLMSWYMSWGGSADPSSQWAFRIGSSHCHFGYQNPVAAYALTQVDDLKPKSQNGERDWTESLKRQMEFYTWLQSKEGAIAGGATNSWNGDYSTYPAGKSTFYGMAYDKDPVYHDPGSGTWFGWQAWSMERVAEYYYITNDAMAKALMDKWASWVKSEVKLIGSDDFEIPATLEWSGEPDTWNPGSPGSNSNLSVTVTDYGKDLGVAASMAKALIYYAAATEKHATLDTEARDLAKEVLDRMWVTYRDDKGVSSPEERGDYSRMFEEEVYIPQGFTGEMANGDEIKPGVSFLDIRSGYRNDPDFAKVEAAYNAGEAYTQRYHRSWAQIEVALANAEYGFFFGDNNSSSRIATEDGVQSFDIIASPNPTSDYLNIMTNRDMEGASTIRVMDLTGKTYLQDTFNEASRTSQLSLQGLRQGIYILEVVDLTTNEISRKKIILK